MLTVAVTGSDDRASKEVMRCLDELAAGAGQPAVEIAHVRVPDPGAYHLVVAVHSPRSRETIEDRAQADAWVSANDTGMVQDLWQQRIAPFAANLAQHKRAPRRQQVVLAGPDPTWRAQAERLISRLAPVVGKRARRIDHIGSTSVPGMSAKDIIDLQVVVEDLDTAIQAAADSYQAGFVHVVGPFYGIDRHGTHHDEQVAVDADPGRPANVHFHPASSPIWQEMLLLRDWLRADARHRDEYMMLKRTLAARPGHDVNDYSIDKMPWISQALSRAGDWARQPSYDRDAD